MTQNGELVLTVNFLCFFPLFFFCYDPNGDFFGWQNVVLDTAKCQMGSIRIWWLPSRRGRDGQWWDFPKIQQSPSGALMRRTCWFNIYSDFSHEKVWFTHWTMVILYTAWWWLEPWNLDWLFPIIWGSCHHPNWRFVTFFRGVGLNHIKPWIN